MIRGTVWCPIWPSIVYDQLGDMPILGAITGRGVAWSRVGAEVPNLYQKFSLWLSSTFCRYHHNLFVFSFVNNSKRCVTPRPMQFLARVFWRVIPVNLLASSIAKILQCGKSFTFMQISGKSFVFKAHDIPIRPRVQDIKMMLMYLLYVFASQSQCFFSFVDTIQSNTNIIIVKHFNITNVINPSSGCQNSEPWSTSGIDMCGDVTIY